MASPLMSAGLRIATILIAGCQAVKTAWLPRPMRRCNIRILHPTFPDSATCTLTAVFILSPGSVTDGSLMGSDSVGLPSTTATGPMGHNLDGFLSEANHGDGCLTTMAGWFFKLASVGRWLPTDFGAGIGR